MKTKHARFSEKQTFLTPSYAHVPAAGELTAKTLHFNSKNFLFLSQIIISDHEPKLVLNTTSLVFSEYKKLFLNSQGT